MNSRHRKERKKKRVQYLQRKDKQHVRPQKYNMQIEVLEEESNWEWEEGNQSSDRK